MTEEHAIHFRLHVSRQKHTSTHVSRLEQSRNPTEIQGRWGEEKIMLCPSPHSLATPLCTAKVSLSSSPEHSRMYMYDGFKG